MLNSLAKLRRMGTAEIVWRAGCASRVALDRGRTAVRAPGWDRRDLKRTFIALPELDGARRALHRQDWESAHRALSDYFAGAPQLFVIAPSLRDGLARRVRRAFPDSERHATARADRVLAGHYDLLGYRGLRFDLRVDGPSSCGPVAPSVRSIDWHHDPVHDRHAPERFWTAVPFLNPLCGDHKIIWELNRHQHWLTLGRAFWLGGDTKYRAAVLDELQDWLSANPPLMGINWASMLELSFRALSWLWALNLFVDPTARDRTPWTVDLLLGLDRQLNQVERNLSYYFSPNTHLLGEAVALYVAGRALPLLKRSERRAALGRRVLLAEIPRQIAADGGHCERSTYYHRYALDFYLLALTVARITKDPAATEFEDAVARLGAAARLLADDEGRLPHIGDDDGGLVLPIVGRPADDIRDSLAAASALTGRSDLLVGALPEEPLWLLAHPELACTLTPVQAGPARTPASPPAPDQITPSPATSGALPATGYYVSRSPGGSHLVIDAGAHGYQNGAHAHADALSLTMSVRGLPLLIDPGTGCYTVDSALRDRLRSTQSHNTVTLDDRSQSLAGGPFHWRQVANARAIRWRVNAGFDYFDGAHDGYRPLEHRRHVLSLPGDLLVVADFVHAPRRTAESRPAQAALSTTDSHAGLTPHQADVHWHIDPQWTIEILGRRAALSAQGERVDLAVATAGNSRLAGFTADENSALGWHAPVYGRVEPAPTLRVRQTGDTPIWIVSVFGLDAGNPLVDVEMLPVWAEAGALDHSVAVRISRAASIDHFLVAEPPNGEAGSVPGPGARTWRVGEWETDARMLFCRMHPDHRIGRVALVDGSMVRAPGRRLLLALARPLPDLDLNPPAMGSETMTK